MAATARLVTSRPVSYTHLDVYKRQVLGRQRLHMLKGFGHHDAIDQNAGNLDLPRIERRALGLSLIHI